MFTGECHNQLPLLLKQSNKKESRVEQKAKINMFPDYSLHENQLKLLGYQGWVEILMITLVYSKRVSVRNNLLHSVSTQ